MRYSDIRLYLKRYSIVASRTTTVNHAFAAAIAPCDSYEEQKAREPVSQLGQDPNGDLACAYCASRAEPWDHVYATVQDTKFSGFGHRLGNLVPCCKPCNSRKGNKTWSSYLDSLGLDEGVLATRKRLIEGYPARYRLQDAMPESSPEYRELQERRSQVLGILDGPTSLRSKSG